MMLGTKLDSAAYAGRIKDELDRLDHDAIHRWSDLVYRAWDEERCVYIIGNGGSGTSATHMSQDFAKSLVPDDKLRSDDIRRLKVVSLTDNVGWIMSIANDLDYSDIFVQQLMNLAEPGDILIATSISGNSENVSRAVTWANEHGMTTFGLSGYDGGSLKEVQQDGIHIDIHDMGMTEGILLCLFHWVLNDVYARMHEIDRYRRA